MPLPGSDRIYLSPTAEEFQYLGRYEPIIVRDRNRASYGIF
jgi:hypothetical protein